MQFEIIIKNCNWLCDWLINSNKKVQILKSRSRSSDADPQIRRSITNLYVYTPNHTYMPISLRLDRVNVLYKRLHDILLLPDFYILPKIRNLARDQAYWKNKYSLPRGEYITLLKNAQSDWGSYAYDELSLHRLMSVELWPVL